MEKGGTVLDGAEGSHSEEVASEQDMNERRHKPGVCLEERVPGTVKVRAEAAERNVLEPGITQSPATFSNVAGFFFARRLKLVETSSLSKEFSL